MAYIDGYVLAIPVKNIKKYCKMATDAGQVWKKHGAIEYVECVMEDGKGHKGLMPFKKTVKCKPGETVVFAYVVYKNRKHRDQVNAKVFKDPYMQKPPEGSNEILDMKRMAYGGFETIVDL